HGHLEAPAGHGHVGTGDPLPLNRRKAGGGLRRLADARRISVVGVIAKAEAVPPDSFSSGSVRSAADLLIKERRHVRETTIGHELVEEPAGGVMPSAAPDEQPVAMLVDRACNESLPLTR
ncbi:hypothetical protein, partial [Streptomyces sp. NPDC058625]|uniref:hypothetical protein n=1 Tax=Streptomyces sp. NPDC058625 TaxID=3346564 RepID=UPI0036611893